MEKELIKELVKAELGQAEERLEAGQILLKNDKIVDAVNRFYYAAFHAARAVLNSIGLNPKTHTGLLSQFGIYVVKNKLMDEKFGNYLRKLMEARESGDYKIEAIFSTEDVKDLGEMAKKFVLEAKKIAMGKIK
ncbi:MAG: HEPN domain-containing protein [Candidatus Aenigmarchaeota archaeon]|nr:HEPN domain-containing protein [Candidatus Aenigmarchaeota archaeon]